MADEITRRDATKTLGAMVVAANVSADTPGEGLCFLTAREMARLLRAKKVSARELLDAHLARIARFNPKVNAIVTLVADLAREHARQADEAMAHGKPLGTLHGLPIAHKDLNDTRGIRTTYGSRIFFDNIPAEDALIVERIRKAGAITIGKTNTPEFGAGSQTFNEVFGATRNPYDVSKTCGGSSGGAAVALACGFMPIADGSDMGGSLRNPASFCNVVGLRPAPGRVPKHSKTAAWSTLSVDGPMARNVADVAFFLSALAGPDARSPIAIREDGARFTASLERSWKGVRVAFFRDAGGLPIDPRVRTLLDAQRQTFELLGCTVEAAEPDFSGADEAFKIIRGWLFAAQYAEFVRTKRELVKDTVIWEVERGLRITGSELSRAEALHSALYDRFRIFFEKYDYFVLPATQVPPFDVTEPYVSAIDGVKMDTYIDWMKSCYFISTTGHPAISVPCGFTPEGLPVGVQIVGRHQDEWSVLQIAHAFEGATGFGKQHPKL